jgi:hypothetical protein
MFPDMLRAFLFVLLLAAVLCAYVALQARPVGAHHIARSAAARRAFRKMHPCPATGRVKGPCPGFVIDHVKPLACGGPDAPANMQWQTLADGKAKDAVERKNCASGI